VSKNKGKRKKKKRRTEEMCCGVAAIVRSYKIHKTAERKENDDRIFGGRFSSMDFVPNPTLAGKKKRATQSVWGADGRREGGGVCGEKTTQVGMHGAFFEIYFIQSTMRAMKMTACQAFSIPLP
jgi:hypothetical protein